MEDKDLLDIKLKFSRAMRDLCDVMVEANKHSCEIKLDYSLKDDKFYIYWIDENGKKQLIDCYSAPMNFFVEE